MEQGQGRIRPRRMVLVLGLAVLTAAVGGVTSAARADNAFSDPAGDATQAADIVSVSVKHTLTDDVTFEIGWAGGSRLAPDQQVVLVIDADRNPRTGNKNGYEVVVVIEGEDWWYYRWNGSSLRMEALDDAFLSNTPTGVAVELPFHAINESRSFLFYLLSTSYQADARVDEDAAPDGTDRWQYTVDLKPWTLHASVTEGRPAFPLPGKRFDVTIDVWRAEDGEPVTGGTVQCVARIGATTIAARGAFVKGAPWCTVPIPRNASGKLVRGTIGVSAHGGRVTKKFAFRIL